MSSSDDEGFVWGLGFDPRGGKQSDDRQARPTALWGSRLGLDLGTPQITVGFDSEPNGLEARRQVLWGCENQTDSQDDVQGHIAGHIAEEAAMAVLQRSNDWDALEDRRNPPPESCETETSTMWMDLKLGLSGRGAGSHGWVGSQPLTSAGPRHPVGPEGGRPLEILKRGTKVMSTGSVCPHPPSMEGLLELPSDSDTSDEIDITQLMKVTISHKGQAKASAPKGPGNPRKHPNTHVRESSQQHVPGSFQPSASRGPTSAVERPASGEGHVSSKKTSSKGVWGKGESKPSCQGAAAPSDQPTATRWRKAGQEKPALVGVTSLALEKSIPFWSQRMLITPLEPVTLPDNPQPPASGRSKRSSWGPSGIRQHRHGGSRKRSSARKAREVEGVGAEDKDPKKDPGPKGQPPAPKPGAPCVCGHREEFSSGNYNIRPPIIARRPQPSAPSKGDVVPKGSAHSRDQAPPDSAPRLDRQPELPPGAEGCPRCPVLQREVDSLREKLGAMEALAKKFQSLSS